MDISKRFSKKQLILAAGLVFVLVILGIFSATRKSYVVNPADNLDVEGDAGNVVVNWIFKYSDIYEAIDENDSVLSNIEDDILLFARATQEKFEDPNTLVGFTFNKEFEKKGDTYVFTGHYFDLEDTIEVILTPHGRGVYTLSITNLRDGTNIDDQLSLNGRRNEYIKKLPVETNEYSIRYQLTEDRIVVTFYEGYTNQDVDAVVASLSEGLGDAVAENVVFSINRIGVFSLEEVRKNLVAPIPAP